MSSTKFPPLYKDDSNQDETTTNSIISYQKSACSKDDTERIARFVNNEKKRFTVASLPWMDVPQGRELDEPFLEPEVADDIELASQNEIAPIVDSETSRLIGSTTEPVVEPTNPTTRAKRGAKFSERVLDDILYQNHWVDLSHQDARNAIVAGTSYALTGFELDFTETTKNAVKVLACTTCKAPEAWMVSEEVVDEQTPEGALMFSKEPAEKLVDSGVAAAKPDLFGNMTAEVPSCPQCESPFELRRATPGKDFDGDEDVLGNPLEKDVPLPKAFIRLYDDYDVFPIGNGRMKHNFLPEVTIESIVPIEWMMERYGMAKKIKPVSISTLGKEARWHPSGLSMWGYYGVSLSNDQERWVVHRITIRQPFIDRRPVDSTNPDEEMSEPLGRLIISGNDTVLFNGPLMVESQTKQGHFFPRMMLHPFQNEVERDTIHGNGSVDRMMDPQRSIDCSLTQIQFDQATMASPRIATDSDVNLEGQGDGVEGDDSGYAGQILRLKGGAGANGLKVIQGTATHQSARELIEMRVQAIARTTNQSELDRGAAVEGAPSATAQITIGNRLDESRKPKGQRYADRNGRAFSHVLECVNGTYVDSRQLKAGYKSDKRAPRVYTAEDLQDQCQVKVGTKPAHENAAFERQAAVEGLAVPGLIPLDTPDRVARIRKLLGIPSSLDPEPSQQLTQAENEFIDFMFGDPDPVAPVVKVRSDAHRIHISQHYDDLRSTDGEALSRFWSLVEIACEGWMDYFETMEAAVLASKQPTPEPSVIKNPIDGKTDVAASIGTSEAWSYKMQAKQFVESLPKNIEQRIFISMARLLVKDQKFIALQNEEDQRDAMMLVRWLAHIEAHEYAETMGKKPIGVPVQADPMGAPMGPTTTVQPPKQLPAARPSPQPVPA